MPDPNVRIILEAVDKASPAFKATSGGLTNMEKAIKGVRTQFDVLNKDMVVGGVNLGNLQGAFRALGINIPTSPAELFTTALSEIVKFTKQAVGETVAYAQQVREMSQAMGMSADETSRLIQLADDYLISVDEIRVAMQMATKNGFKPGIEGLAELADKYREIADPTKQAAMLSEIFGRNWARMVPLLQQGGDAVRAQAAAIDDSLIMTEQAIQDARDYEIALDNLNDAVAGVKYQIGMGLVPMLTDLAKAFSLATILSKSGGTAVQQYSLMLGMAVLRGKDLSEIVDMMNAVLEDDAGAAREAALAMRYAAKSNQELGDTMSPVADRAQKQAALLREVNEALDEQARAEQTAMNAAIVADQRRLERLGVLDQLKDAERELATLQKDAAQSVGDDVAAAFAKAGVEGEKLTAAYTIMDQVLHTNFIGQQNYNNLLEEAIKNFDPQHPEIFRAALEELQGEFEKISEPIQAAILKVDEFNLKYQSLQGQHVETYIDVYAIQHAGPPNNREQQTPRRFGGEQAEANGGFNPAGSWAMVGERGPEPIYFGQDARVFSNESFKQAMGGGGDMYFEFNISGVSDPRQAANAAARKFSRLIRSGALQYAGQ